MDIQWFPGHMTKTKRQLLEQLKWVDVIIETGDARLPLSSRNPLLRELLGAKPKLLVLNKADLADEDQTGKWLKKLEQEGPVLAVSASTGAGMKKIIPMLEELMAEKWQKLAEKGIKKPIRVMVVGIPNTGKSTIINTLTGRAQARTGNKPGVTRGSQWLRIHGRIELLDTPGMLWPKFDDQIIGRKLAASGAVRDEVFDLEELAQWLIAWLQTNYQGALNKYYKTEQEEINLETIGKERGCLISGGRVDTLKAAQIFFREFRSAKIARATLDRLE
ncbi:Ras superfamily GTP-binding protein YlqF [Syntrophobotulus glycolicus DSM 8271]|uniref:Ribosome biogenesis GTPase A n=1 Tax=Syntrophobotulus glycolicus (strain DSM 8271 / FlGlyR) TaxID=645991 RepID=F0SUD7_SYNGF|nr:ribosome biogenesis GTPase YlqF [Syntrophobotulus glycolicus]ADY56587.1 Ras superfamily GTP-binding protein YlqF [Syntrophobotulus glycolicus DSM 8271]